VEILVALGAGPRLAGVSDFAADLPGAAGLPTLGGFTPDLERVVALKPDLVVVSRDGTDRASWEKLTALGLPVVVTSGRTLDGVLDDIRAVGAAAGESAAAAKLVAALAARIAAAEARAAARPGPPLRAVAVIWPDPPVVAGPSTFVGDLLARARIANVVPAGGAEWPRVTLEALAAWNPGVVIWPATKENEAAFRRAFQGDAHWKLVPAVRDGRLVTVPGNLLERPGPGLVEALEILTALPPAGVAGPG
jgi:iron complex transport system substrate-binding protein